MPRRLPRWPWSLLALAGCSVSPPGDPDAQTQTEGSGAGAETAFATETGPPPQLCDEDECGPWETCTSPSGQCDVDCLATIQPVIDPPGSCEIQLVDFPKVVTIFVVLSIDGVSYYPDFDCAEEMQENFPIWVWLVEGETMLLCDQMCALFEAAREVEVGLQCESA